MKSYKDTEIKSSHWLKRQKYVPASDVLGDGLNLGWKLVDRFPVSKIIHDPSQYPNPLKISQVIEMMDEFHPFGFLPLLLDNDFRLLDGQHRLTLAQWCCFEFVDVWIVMDDDSPFSRYKRKDAPVLEESTFLLESVIL